MRARVCDGFMRGRKDHINGIIHRAYGILVYIIYEHKDSTSHGFWNPPCLGPGNHMLMWPLGPVQEFSSQGLCAHMVYT